MEKKGTSVFSNSLIWFGAGVSIAEILTGTYFAPLGFGKAMAAILLGHLIGGLMMFAAGMIGGACGALVAGWTGIGATAYGVTGLFGYLITTDDTLQYTLVIAVAFVVSFVISWVLYHDEKTPGEKTAARKQ